jgi:hypothetical protein
MSPLSPVVTPAVFGNMARDGGNLIVEADDGSPDVVVGQFGSSLFKWV